MMDKMKKEIPNTATYALIQNMILPFGKNDMTDVEAERRNALDEPGAALGINDDDVAGALVHGGGAHAGQVRQIILQLIGLGQRHPLFVEMQADPPLALMQNVPFHCDTLPKQKLPAEAGSLVML